MVELSRLLEIMARLRDPKEGCPWDLAQDFESISPFTIEEAYEVDEAIASGDPEALRDELGDLLFQVVFQARIAEERGLFDFEGVVEAIASKLVRRHPHVFADAETPGSVAGQLASWEDIKAAERTASGKTDEAAFDPFYGIPRHLPALARSAKIAGRAGRVVPAKALEEAGGRAEQTPLEAALEAARRSVGNSPPANPGEENAAEWIGQGLSSWVRLARELGVDPEQALRRADDERMERVRRRLEGTPSAAS
jgi:ATP diphosphatase